MNGTRRDWLEWAAAACALAATASAEYELALAAHWGQWVALALPGSLDAYVLRALQSGREVPTAVLAMVAVNAASHLVTAGMLTVSWWLVTAVAAVPALVLWRVHALRTAPVTEASTVTQPSPAPVPEASTPARSTLDEHADSVPGMLTYVPAEWSRDPDACTCLFDSGHARPDQECTGCEHAGHAEGRCLSRLPLGTDVPPAPVSDGHGTERGMPTGGTDPIVPPLPWESQMNPFTMASWEAPSVPERDRPADVLPFPGTLPPGFTASTEDPDALRADDREAVTVLIKHMQEHDLADVPTQRDVKTICSVGTPKARRVHKHVTACLREGVTP